MKKIHVIGSMAITALLSVGGTYMVLENKHEKELPQAINEVTESLKNEMALKEEPLGDFFITGASMHQLLYRVINR